MSVNCIRCIGRKRTGPDLLCDQCRGGSLRFVKSHRAYVVFQGKEPIGQIREHPARRTKDTWFFQPDQHVPPVGDGLEAIDKAEWVFVLDASELRQIANFVDTMNGVPSER